MFIELLVKVTGKQLSRRITMDNTHEYVEKLHKNQKKAEQNKKRQGNGSPDEKLPNNRH